MKMHHPTTHKRPAFKVPPPQPAPSVLEAAASSIKDVLGTDTHVRISVTEFAQLAEDRRKLQAVEAILRANEPTWTPTHKTAAALMYLDGKPFGDVIPSQHTPNTLAAALNVSTGTARTALQQMKTANVLDYDSKAIPVNRYGEPLERGVIGDKTRGDRFERSVTITLPAQPVIKPLTATATQTKDKAVKRQQRDELRELRTKLAALECPECGTTGHLQIVCGECGCKLDATLETSESDFSRTPATNAPADEQPVTPEPAAAAAASLEKSDSDVSKVLAVATLETSKIDVCNKENSKFDVSTFGTEEGVTHDEPPPTTNEPDAMPPAANISPAQLTQLLGNEARYIAAKYHSKQRAERGDATQLDAATALLKLEDTHNIVLSGSGYAIIDIDVGIDELLNAYPQLRNAPTIYRVNALNRGKLIIKCSDAKTIAKHQNEAKTHEIELKREAVVMGIHETGTQILCKHNGQPIPVLAMAEVETLIRSFAPIAIKPKQQAAKFTPFSVPINKTNTRAEGDVRAAINWWNGQPANVAEVERLISQLPHKGKAFALRADDKTPSTVYQPAQEKYDSPTWRDFGTGISRDALDMYVLLTGCDKRRFIGEVMRNWRAWRNCGSKF